MPAEAPIPTPPQKDDCVDAYFEHYHPQYPILHEPTFRAQWNEVSPTPPADQWRFLSSVVMAVGAFSSSRRLSIVDHYLSSATSSVQSYLLEEGSLTLVQAFCLLGDISQKRNKPNSASIYIGMLKDSIY